MILQLVVADFGAQNVYSSIRQKRTGTDCARRWIHGFHIPAPVALAATEPNRFGGL